eukprot:4176680-Prymnesium_polylepis.1
MARRSHAAAGAAAGATRPLASQAGASTLDAPAGAIVSPAAVALLADRASIDAAVVNGAPPRDEAAEGAGSANGAGASTACVRGGSGAGADWCGGGAAEEVAARARSEGATGVATGANVAAGAAAGAVTGAERAAGAAGAA